MKEYKCEFCSKSFRDKKRFENHLLKNHSLGWIWKCNICLKEFPHHRSLNAHKNSHLDRPKRGQNKSSLNSETVTSIRKRRSEIHDCKWCGKIYDTGQKLGGHIRFCENNPEKNDHVKRQTKICQEIISREEVREKLSSASRNYLKNNPHMIPYLRNHSSKKSFPEVVFENLLIENNIDGWYYNFPFGGYAYDFAFEKIKLDVEIDGQQHEQEKRKKHDEIRDTFSKENGWYVHRISAKDLRHKENHQKIVENLKEVIQNLTNNL